MSIKTIWNERFGMLMASGSPGSALAYQVGSTAHRTVMPRRNIATDDAPEATAAARTGARGFSAWLRRLFDRFEAWTYSREMREVEAYLAQAQNHADLEARMRHLHDSLLSRARTLR